MARQTTLRVPQAFGKLKWFLDLASSNIDDSSRVPVQAIKFGLVGAVAGVADYSVMISLRESWSIDPVNAAACGYLAGSLVSYVFNRSLTFRSQRAHSQAMLRFAAVNIVGFVLTTILMSILTNMFGINYLLSRLTTTVAVFGLNFFSHRLWTFREVGADRMTTEALR